MDASLVLYYGIGTASILTAAGVGYWVSDRFNKKVPHWVLYTLIGLSAYIFIAQHLKVRSLHMYVDVAHWLQLARTIAETGLPYSLNHEFIVPGTLNYLSVHFVPLFYFFAVVYRIIPYTETLLFLGTA